MTKEERREYNKAYIIANRKKLYQVHKKWRDRNKTKIYLNNYFYRTNQMNKQLKKAVKKYGKLQDVFATTKHAERQKERLKFKYLDLDANAPDILQQDTFLKRESKDSDLKSQQIDNQRSRYTNIVDYQVDNPIGHLSVKQQAKYWQDLQSPVKISSNDKATPSDYPNDLSL